MILLNKFLFVTAKKVMGYDNCIFTRIGTVAMVLRDDSWIVLHCSQLMEYTMYIEYATIEVATRVGKFA